MNDGLEMTLKSATTIHNWHWKSHDAMLEKIFSINFQEPKTQFIHSYLFIPTSSFDRTTKEMNLQRKVKDQLKEFKYMAVKLY